MLILILLYIFYEAHAALATLSYPTGIFLHGRVVCSSPVASGATLTTVTYTAAFNQTAIVTLGVTGMDFMPGLSIDFRTLTPTTTGTNFVVEVTVGASTTFPFIKYSYLAYHPQATLFDTTFSAILTTFLQFATTTINTGTGFRRQESTFSMRASTAYRTTSFFSCSAMIIGFVGTTTDSYEIETSCYCTLTSPCTVLTTVNGNTRISNMRVAFFIV